MRYLSELANLQRNFAQAIMRPLNRATRAANAPVAASLVKPNRILSAQQRLAIYHRQYWFRLMECLTEDFPGVKAIAGSRFTPLCEAYLARYPSTSYTLRDLGSRLWRFMREPGAWQRGLSSVRCEMAMEMAALEWAQVVAFDAAQLPAATPTQVAEGDFALQPYLTLLKLRWPLDQYLLQVRRGQRARLPQARRCHLAVHRADETVHFKLLDPWQYRLLRSMARGDGLARSLRQASPDPTDVRDSFAQWMNWGWFCVPEVR